MIYFNKTIVKKLQLWYIINEFHGDVAQLARAFGSYPLGGVTPLSVKFYSRQGISTG